MGAALWFLNKNKFKPKKIKNLYLGDSPIITIFLKIQELKQQQNKLLSIYQKEIL